MGRSRRRGTAPIIAALLLTAAACTSGPPGYGGTGGSGGTGGGGGPYGGAAAGGGTAGAPSGLAAEGRDIATRSGCAGCHGPQFAGGSGPSLVGLYGTEVTFTDGTSTVADADYLTESIRDPAKRVVEGYPNVMPPNRLTDVEVDAVVAYVESLASTSSSTSSGE